MAQVVAKVILSETALADLKRIHDHIAAESEQNAGKFLEGVFDRIGRLKQMPLIGHPVPELLPRILREIHYKSYRIIYSVDEPGEQARVLTIIHSRQNAIPLLQGL